MHRIVSIITSLQQHLEALSSTPEVYRPSACPHCGLGCLWRHGIYHRKADRSPPTSGRLNPIPILRFRCRGCRHTCSRLPACIAPRRWYDWAVQQQIVLMLLAGYSLRAVNIAVQPCRATCRRWWQWLEVRSESFCFHLRSRFPELGRAVDLKSMWRVCLERMPLRDVMAWLDRNDVSVP